MRTYIVNPDRTVTTTANKTTDFAKRLADKYPTPNIDKLTYEEINKYDEHKLYK